MNRTQFPRVPQLSFCLQSEQLVEMSDWVEPTLHTYEVPCTTANRRMFRQIARESCGESMEPTDGDLILFGEIAGVKDPVCVICGTRASDTSDRNDREFYHWVKFLFVMGNYQGCGYGSTLLDAMQRILRTGKLRPIRVESASKATPFFKKQGYSEIGDPIQCINSGSPLFRILQKMEKFSCVDP